METHNFQIPNDQYPYPPATEPLENDTLISIFSEYLDVWSALHNDKKGYTFDSVSNKMLLNFEQMRYDRIFLKAHCSWQPSEIFLMGTENIKNHLTKQGKPLFPSDHFGLFAKFKHIKNE